MQLITNTVEPQNVREETRDGDRWLIAEDVPFVRAMELSGGYVPDEHIRASTGDWHGVPTTLNHPRNDAGEPIAATSDDVVEEFGLGIVENPRYDGEFVRGDLGVNAEKAERMGGEAMDVVRALENGDAFDVSSQYEPAELSAGVYDDQYREHVEGIKRPDSVALLPNKQGQCSIEHGCGFQPTAVAANAAETRVRVPAWTPDDPTGARSSGRTEGTMRINRSVGGISYSGTAGGTLDKSEIPNDDYADHFVFDGDTKSESGFPLVDAEGNLRAGNVAAAFRFRNDAPDTDELLDVLEAVNDEFDEPPIEPESLEEAMTSNADTGLVGSVRSFLGWGNDTDESLETTPAESGVDATDADSASAVANGADDGTTDTPASEPEGDMDREELITEITENSALTRNALEERCDDGLEAIHEDVMADAGGDGGSGEPTTNDGDFVTQDDLEEFGEQLTESIKETVTANAEEEQKQELAKEIVANSNEYEDTESVLDDLPTVPALEAKRDSLDSAGVVMPGRGGSTATTANAGETDADDFGTGVISND